MSPPERFNQVLRRLRHDDCLTQRELSQQAFCSLDTIKKLESGTRLPSRHLAEQLAGVFGLAGAEREAFLDIAGKRLANGHLAPTHSPLAQHTPVPTTPSHPIPGTPLIGRG